MAMSLAKKYACRIGTKFSEKMELIGSCSLLGAGLYSLLSGRERHSLVTIVVLAIVWSSFLAIVAKLEQKRTRVLTNLTLDLLCSTEENTIQQAQGETRT